MKRIYFILLALGFLVFLFASPSKVLAGSNGSSCKCDHGEGFWGTCSIAGSPCDANYPYCIAGTCYDTKNPSGGVCGEAEDCQSNTCIESTCQSRETGATCRNSLDCNNGICGQQSSGSKLTCSAPQAPTNTPTLPIQVCADCFFNGQTCTAYTFTDNKAFCVNKWGLRLNALCKYPNGSPNDEACESKYCNPTTLNCDTKPSSLESNSCIDKDNRVGTFQCKTACVAGVEEDTTSNDGYHSCSSGRCCKDIAKYAQYYGHLSPNSGTTPPVSSVTPGGAGGGTTAPGQTGPASGPCAKEKGGEKTGGYINAFCDEKAYNLTDAQAGKFCNTKYTDWYTCNNIDPATGKNYIDKVPGSDTICNTAWCPPNAGATCRTDCKTTYGPNSSCTYDYFNVDPRITNSTTCCPDGKRYCPIAGTCVSASQGCGSTTGIGQGISCNPAATLPREKCDLTQNLYCKDFGNGFPTCQYKEDSSGNPVIFTPTPGAPSSESCDQQIANGRGVIGCACPNGGGCISGVGCYQSSTGSMTDNKTWFCSNGSGTWCEKSQSLVERAALCTLNTPFVSPSPTPNNSGYQFDCPGTNPGGTINECLGAAACTTYGNYTQHGTGPSGTSNGDQICSELNGTPNHCCTKLPAATTTSAPTSSSGGGTPTTAPVTSIPTHTPSASVCSTSVSPTTPCYKADGTSGDWGWDGEYVAPCTSNPNSHKYSCR